MSGRTQLVEEYNPPKTAMWRLGNSSRVQEIPVEVRARTISDQYQIFFFDTRLQKETKRYVGKNSVQFV